MSLFGTPTLHSIARESIKDLSQSELSIVNQYHNILLNKSNGKDWLLPYLCQYDNRYLPCLIEAYYLTLICEMIYAGHIYLLFIKTSNWADADVNKKENFKTLIDSGIYINEKYDNDDGVFEINKDIFLKKLYIDDKTCLQNENNFKDVIKKNQISGYVEFGTQSAAKTYQYLKRNIPLLRLPYDFGMEELNPAAAILINTKEFNPLDF